MNNISDMDNQKDCLSLESRDAEENKSRDSETMTRDCEETVSCTSEHKSLDADENSVDDLIKSYEVQSLPNLLPHMP